MSINSVKTLMRKNTELRQKLAEVEAAPVEKPATKATAPAKKTAKAKAKD
jgi:hypothetical protein